MNAEALTILTVVFSLLANAIGGAVWYQIVQQNAAIEANRSLLAALDSKVEGRVSETNARFDAQEQRLSAIEQRLNVYDEDIKGFWQTGLDEKLRLQSEQIEAKMRVEMERQMAELRLLITQNRN